MTNPAKDNINENKFQHGRAYYSHKSSLPIDECESHRIHYDDMDDEIYMQNLLCKNSELNIKGKVIITNGVKDNACENKFRYGRAYHFHKSGLPIDECESHRLHSECMNDEIYMQNLLNKKNELNKKGKVITPCASLDNTNENKLQYGKTYYFDKSGFPIDKCESHRLHSKCKEVIETCCLIEIPRGFCLTDCQPGMCFNLAGLSCVKNPIIQKVTLPVCECEHPKKCEVVAGYEIRAVGEVNFSTSFPIRPISGFCSSAHCHVSCSSTVPVNEIISTTCCPKPGPCNEPCVDWSYAYFCATLVECDHGSYIRATMGVALEYTGNCECDEE